MSAEVIKIVGAILAGIGGIAIFGLALYYADLLVKTGRARGRRG